MTCLAIGILIAVILRFFEAELVKSIPARLRSLTRKQGMVRGYLIYSLERKR